MLSYRVMLDLPAELVGYVSRLLAARRRELGTPAGSRALTCRMQAVFVLENKPGDQMAMLNLVPWRERAWYAVG